MTEPMGEPPTRLDAQNGRKALNHTALRHRLLIAVGNGEVTMIVTVFFLSAGARRQMDVLVDQGFINTATSPTRLTAAGLVLLTEWNEKHGAPSKVVSK